MYEIEIPKQFIVTQCDICGTRHAPVSRCLQDAYMKCLSTVGVRISYEDFLKVWEEFTDDEKAFLLTD